MSPELLERAQELVDRYPVARSALLPLLHLVQTEHGYVSGEGVAMCAELLSLTKAEVAAVATFYTMYKRAPMGRHLVSVCTNFSCKVRGGQEVYDRLSERLGVGHNGTTADDMFTLEHAECLGNCEGAPVVTVDYLNYECLDPDAAVDLVERIAGGEVPAPTRGFTPPGVREVERILAGYHPTGGIAGDALATDAAPPVPDSGPGGTPVPITPSLSDEDTAQREEARRQVADAGQDAETVEAEGGPRAREFPTRPQEGQPPQDQPTESLDETAGEGNDD